VPSDAIGISTDGRILFVVPLPIGMLENVPTSFKGGSCKGSTDDLGTSSVSESIGESWSVMSAEAGIEIPAFILAYNASMSMFEVDVLLAFILAGLLGLFFLSVALGESAFAIP
jgi:hypothetical protein